VEEPGLETADAFIARVKQTRSGRIRKAKDIGRKGTLFWQSEAVTLRPQTNYSSTVFMIERLKLIRVEGERFRSDGPEIGDVTYRIAYYTRARNDKWHWGQYSPIIPAEDLEPLLTLARAEGTVLPSA
jgi:hypothetical protein